jgi:hypothetical protein
VNGLKAKLRVELQKRNAEVAPPSPRVYKSSIVLEPYASSPIAPRTPTRPKPISSIDKVIALLGARPEVELRATEFATFPRLREREYGNEVHCENIKEEDIEGQRYASRPKKRFFRRYFGRG